MGAVVVVAVVVMTGDVVADGVVTEVEVGGGVDIVAVGVVVVVMMVGVGVVVNVVADGVGAVVTGVADGLHAVKIHGNRMKKAVSTNRILRIIQSLFLFPLYSGGRLGGDIVDDAVHARDLVNDAVGDACQQVVGQSRPVGGHGILAVDGPHGHHVAVGAEVAHDPHGVTFGQNAEALP
jgi:hypothetical protein